MSLITVVSSFCIISLFFLNLIFSLLNYFDFKMGFTVKNIHYFHKRPKSFIVIDKSSMKPKKLNLNKYCTTLTKALVLYVKTTYKL